jgi:Uma2 family endonuclease
MTAIPLPGAKLMTFAEFLNWKPEQKRYELHNGTPIEMQPTGEHEEVVEFLATTLTREAGRLNLPYRFPRQALIKASEGETGYLPDVIIVDPAELINEPLWKQSATIIQGKTVVLVVEVVSTNWRDDYGYKLTAYEALGIPEYWIADYLGLGGIRHIGSPKQPTLSIYSLIENEYQVQQFHGDDLIQSQLFPDLQITAAQIFRAGLEES